MPDQSTPMILSENIPTPPSLSPESGNGGSEVQKERSSISVDGVEYAVGLMWQPLQNPDDPIPEIRETMEAEPGIDLYCLRSATSPQYGVGRKSNGHKEGEPSAAAAVAGALADKTSACCVFKVPEGWWFVAIRNDLILSEEDVLFKTEEEAQQAFFSMMAVPDWEIRIAPQSWGIENSEEMDLAKLIKNTRKIRLVELSAIKRTQILLFIAIAILGLLGGLIYLIVSLWNTVFTQEKIVPMPMPEVIKPVEPIPEKPKPWEKIPETHVFLNKCWNNSYQLSSITIPGWQLGMVSCTPKGIMTSWSKSWNPGGRIAWLKAALNEYNLSPRVSVQLNDTGTNATGSVSFTDIPLVASVPTLTETQIRESLTDIAQATNLPIQFSKQTVLDPPNNADGTVPPNQQTYVFFSFSISSSYTPWEWRTFFDKFSGLDLQKIEFNPSIDSTNKWKYEGRIYAK